MSVDIYMKLLHQYRSLWKQSVTWSLRNITAEVHRARTWGSKYWYYESWFGYIDGWMNEVNTSLYVLMITGCNMSFVGYRSRGAQGKNLRMKKLRLWTLIWMYRWINKWSYYISKSVGLYGKRVLHKLLGTSQPRCTGPEPAEKRGDTVIFV